MMLRLLAKYTISMWLLFSCIESSASEGGEAPLVQKAYQDYLHGLEAKDRSVRQKLLKEALSGYVQAAQIAPSGAVFANIGTLYMYLSEPALATIYLKKAMEFSPRDPEVSAIAALAQKAMGLEGKYLPPSWSETISCSTWLSYSDKNAFLLLFTLIAFVLFSFSVWASIHAFRQIALFFSGIVAALVLIFYGVPLAFEKPKAVVTQSFFLKASGASAQPASNENFVIPGEELVILASDTDGKWLRVRTAHGIIGYISGDAVQLTS